ncbi:MAG: hypothetical protein U0Y10_02470 [Spirosomataceae bacterium]
MKTVIVEGIPDAALMKVFGFTTKQIIKEGSKGNVCNRLEKSTQMLGMVDEDPTSAGQPKYLKSLTLTDERYEIKTYFDSQRQNKLIVLCPNLEEWLLNVVRKEKVELDKLFGLPTSAQKLHKVINHEIPKFEKLINSLIEKNTTSIVYLKNSVLAD